MPGMHEAGETVEQFQRVSTRWLKDRLPLLGELRAYGRRKFRADLLAGATVSLVSVPQAIGFALIAGLPPFMVIMSVIVGGFVCSLLSSSRHMVFGPTNSISIILAATIYNLKGGALAPTELVLLLGFLIGIFQLAAGLTQLGRLTQFISRSVIVAYGTAIGLLLVAGQAPNLLGVPPGERGGFLLDLARALAHLAHLDFNEYAALLGFATLALFSICRRLLPRIPPELPVLVLLGLLAHYTGFDQFGGIRTIGGEGELGVSLPSFIGMPLGQSNLDMVPPLLGAALAIAILGMLEAIAISKTLAAKSGQRLDANQELVAMGAANLVTSAYGAMPGSASFARSATNLQSGAQTQISGLLSSIIVFLALVFVSPVINFIPVPCLAAQLIRIGLHMLNFEQIHIARRATRSDGFVFWTTLAAAIFLKLDTAIYVGIGVSLMLFLRKAGSPSLVEYTFNESGNLAELEDKSQRSNSAISIIHVEGELFFGAADLFQEQVRYLADDDNIRVFILRMKNARHLDATSVMSLLQLHEYLARSDRHLIVSGISEDVERVLRDSGALDKIGAENIFKTEINPTISTRRALQRAIALLGVRSADVRIFYDRRKETAAAPADAGSPADYEI